MIGRTRDVIIGETPESGAPGQQPRLAGLTVVSGPTAVGKGTVVGRLAEQYPAVWVSVSATTRQPRPGETDGVHYRFVDEGVFDQMIDNNELLEWARVHGRYRYGTPWKPVWQALHAGRSAILEIDLQGARQVRRSCPDASFVFVAAPSWEELLDRQAGRGTETAAERARRLSSARAEMAAADEFDHTIVNSDVQTAVSELAALLGL
jgi:guanylate kinase